MSATKHLPGRLFSFLLALGLLFSATGASAQNSVVYEGKAGPGKGKHVVFVSGDEEYRSEESLPMLAKILSQRHGFKCTVLFALDPDGTINPENNASLSDPQALDSADAVVLALRWRRYPDEQMKHFVDAYKRGVPIVALRTSTHPFNYRGNDQTAYRDFNRFGKRVVGEDWVSHWGVHKKEATKGIVVPGAESHAILRGVADVFGNSDVYEAYPPADATILMRGQVLKGMTPDSGPADYKKKRATDKQEQHVNDPMMPVAWVREYKNEAGNTNKVFTTTMGASTDLENEGLRRMVVNAVYWGLGLDVPAKADVNYVGDFKATMYGFKGHKKGVKPADHALKSDTGATNDPNSTPTTPILAADIPTDRSSGSPLVLKKGDTVAILGNTLADRMQHFGHLETLVHTRYKDLELVFRNLGFAGDELTIRARSENFGSPDQWLERVKADVVFAFFGFNESFKGEAGIEKFKADLGKFINDTRAKNYSGKGAPRLVLFSPVANERHQDPNYPDPSESNARIAAYTAAMAEVAKANGVAFVDLYSISQKLYADAAAKKQSLTANGLHLSEAGDKSLAPEIFRTVFGESAPELNEQLRAAVNEKNWQFHQRYRTVDGYNVYGGRSRLTFPHGDGKISNYDVMQQEMAQRDVLTANRDKKVWAFARGDYGYKVVDDNLPPVTEVQTNKPGDKPDKTHTFPSGEEMLSKIDLHKGLKIQLFADEKQFPELVKPVQMAWDTKGRLWVASWRNYPELTPTDPIGDSLLIFEDTNNDGKADKVTHFLDGLNCPTGFQFYKDGVLVMQAPDLWFVRDTDGDGKADWKERVVMGLDSADSHHTTNAMAYDPGGAVYLSDGVFHRTQVETDRGPVRNVDAAIYRYEPRTNKFETYISYGFANPHGKVFDKWGNDLHTDATGNNTYFGAAVSGHIDYPTKHRAMRQFWERPSRPCPATVLLTSRHFPEDWWNNFLNFNVIGFQGIYRVKLKEEGSGIWGESLPDMLSGKDPTFRPICGAVAPDGSFYFADWSNAIIGHMQHHLRDPNRDQIHGRIYRVTYEGRPLMKPAKIDGQPIEALLELLKEPENQTRELAKIELSKHDSDKVVAAVKKWVAGLDKSDKEYEHRMMEALWVHQWHNVVDLELLNRMLSSSEPRARAAAARVLCYWRDRVPNTLALLKKAANDESPRVRLEAVRAASFFRVSEAVDVALEVLKKPTDYYLDYCLSESMRQLEPYWRKALAEGKSVAADNPAGIKFLIASVNGVELLKLPRTPEVLQAIVLRAELPEATRSEALNALAEAKKTTRANVVLSAMETVGKTEPAAASILARLLPQQPQEDLKPVREQVMKYATAGASPEVRQSAWGALAVADNGFDAIWTEAAKNPGTLTDLLSGIPTIFDAEIRAKAYEKVQPLLAVELPKELNAGKGESNTKGRFVRIELPRRGTLTLAEVQVFSAGKNVAGGGKAKQSSTANGGEAGRAIDGKINGAFSSGTLTHTAENDRAPWWELDLGSDKSIEAITVWNRSENNGQYAKRLDNFTIKVLDAKRQEVFKKERNPAPAESARFAVGVDGPGALRRAAIGAAVSMQREPEKVFASLAKLIEANDQMVAAARGIRTLPRKSWPKAEGGTVAKALVAWAKKVPAENRTSQEYLETVQLAGDLAALLPAEEATALRKDLKELRVAVFVLTSVREQMRYDTPRLVVEAGKPFEIIFENTDFMPHNVVVVTPGSREKVGTKAGEMTPDQLDYRGRAFVPDMPEVLNGTKLIDAGDTASLKMTAPEQEGVYEYVCTYPGHWELMWGRLVVTKDVDAYLAANPDASVPTTPAKKAAGHEHH